MYYTVVVYLHIHEYAGTQAGPNFTRKPQIADFWISVLSAFAVYYLQKWTTDWLIPIIGRVSEYKPLESKELKHEKSKKAAEKIYKTFWHMGCAIGAYAIIKDCNWLPWYFGGKGDLVYGFENMPFSPMNDSLYLYGLIVFGHPL